LFFQFLYVNQSFSPSLDTEVGSVFDVSVDRSLTFYMWGRGGCDRMVVGFTTIFAINATNRK
jgi:hypothetical protein